MTHEVLPAIRQTGSYSIQQNRPMTALDLYEMSVKVLREHEQRMNSLEQSNEQTARKIESVAHILSTSIVPAEDWQEKTNDTINEIVEANGYNRQKYRRKLYDSLERSARCDLQARQTRFRNRMAKQGKTKTQQKEISKLFIIAQDCKLRKIFESILREEQAKVLCVT